MNKAQKKPLQLQDSLAVRILICVLFPLIAFAGLLLGVELGVEVAAVVDGAEFREALVELVVSPAVRLTALAK